mmetsp:Transcript_61215/g.200084  ORF Transcript_61215/g.200084 Transcript_61215/m.200084 type:complete len:394 (-) Transcript_61215:1331-2512(-)
MRLERPTFSKMASASTPASPICRFASSSLSFISWIAISTCEFLSFKPHISCSMSWICSRCCFCSAAEVRSPGAPAAPAADAAASEARSACWAEASEAWRSLSTSFRVSERELSRLSMAQSMFSAKLSTLSTSSASTKRNLFSDATSPRSRAAQLSESLSASSAVAGSGTLFSCEACLNVSLAAEVGVIAATLAFAFAFAAAAVAATAFFSSAASAAVSFSSAEAAVAAFAALAVSSTAAAAAEAGEFSSPPPPAAAPETLAPGRLPAALPPLPASAVWLCLVLIAKRSVCVDLEGLGGWLGGAPSGSSVRGEGLWAGRSMGSVQVPDVTISGPKSTSLKPSSFASKVRIFSRAACNWSRSDLVFSGLASSSRASPFASANMARISVASAFRAL